MCGGASADVVDDHGARRRRHAAPSRVRGRDAPCSPPAATRSTPRSPRTSRSGSSRRTAAGPAATCSRSCGTAALHGYLGAGRSRRPESTRDELAAELGTHAVLRAALGDRAGRGRRLVHLLERWGTRSFGELAAAAIALADDGFTVSDHAAPEFVDSRAWFREYERVDGAVRRDRRRHALPPAGVARAPCARSPTTDPTRSTAGRSAPRSPSRCRTAGGHLATTDLAAHAGEWCDPLRGSLPRPRRSLELPPPTQGATVLEALRILDGFDVRRPTPAARTHLQIEIVKAALADRDAWISDPEHMPVPATALFADDYVASATGRDRPRPGVRSRAGPSTARRHRVPLRRRRRRTAREPHPVELRRVRLRRVRARVGDQPPQPRRLVLARRRPRQRVRARRSGRCTRSSPRWRCATARRPSCSGRWAATRRPRCTCSCSRTSSTTACDPADGARARAVAARSVHLEPARRVARGPRARRRPRRPRAPRARGTGVGLGDGPRARSSASIATATSRPPIPAPRAPRSASEEIGPSRRPGYHRLVQSVAESQVADVRRRPRRARVRRRRGPRHGDLPRAAARPPAAPRGRGRRRQDRGRQGARPLDRRRARAAAVLRGHRRRPGRLRVGLLAPAAAPAGGRGERRPGRRGRAVLRALPRAPAAARGHRRAAPSTRRCSSSTRSTAPTTSSRRSCSRSSPTTRSRCPSSAPSTPRCRRSSCVTSNRTRDVHDALKRRCLYHWIEHPDFERELAILRVKVPHVPEVLARQVAGRGRSRCAGSSSTSRPGVAETIDWAQALVALEPRRARRRHGRRDARHRPQVPRGPGARAQHRRGARRGGRTSPWLRR